MTMRFRLVPALPLLALAACDMTAPAAPETALSVVEADPPLWFGTWDCDLTQMTFASEGWTAAPGDAPIAILRTEAVPDGALRLTLQGRPPIVIRHDGGDRLSWLSEATGDSMACTRNAG